MDLQQSVRPVEPEFRAAQRARVVLGFYDSEDREWQSWAGEGFVRLDGPWLHLFADQVGYWQSWPAAHVVCVDWRTGEFGTTHGDDDA